MKIVEVEWIDAQSSPEQIYVEDLKNWELVKSKSCGYLLHKDKEKVILVTMLFGDEMVKHFQVIPMKIVKKITDKSRKRK